MRLDELIAIANDGDPDGLIDAYYQDPEWEHGDTLAEFIVNKLSDTYSEEACTDEQIDEALCVLRNAQRELDCVIAAFERTNAAHKQRTANTSPTGTPSSPTTMGTRSISMSAAPTAAGAGASAPKKAWSI